MADAKPPVVDSYVGSDATAPSTDSATDLPNGRQGKTPTKYRHIAAVHARQRTSCLSHDSDQSPSFLGFRNLMVIVLGQYPHRELWITLKRANMATSCHEPPSSGRELYESTNDA